MFLQCLILELKMAVERQSRVAVLEYPTFLCVMLMRWEIVSLDALVER